MKMKHSIRKKMTVIFSVVLLTALGVCWLVNSFFLERYYMRNKQKVLEQVYMRLDTASGQEGLNDSDFVQELNSICETNNISLFVMGRDGMVRLYSMRDYRFMQARLYASLFGDANGGAEGEKILKETSYYTIRTSRDVHMGGEYLEMTGVLEEGELFIVRTAIEPIRESVHLANRFLAYVGLTVLAVGALAVQLLSSRIAEPLLDLAKLSERMSNLDFNVKFSGNGNDEVAFLGNHMNQLSQALEKAISELKTANNELLRDIEQKEKNDEMRREFLANISHELKTPIALIQGYAEGLSECINDDEESREFYCDVIMDEAGKMNTMVKNLLTLNELEFGNEAVTMERFDLTAMIGNMIQSRRILFDQKGIRIVFDVQEPIYVWANESKLSEVMNNYISNAINHAEGEKIIKITIERRDGKVRTGVFNTGKPIPEEAMDRIWDKFFKVDKARTREYGGSGVGLSIVKAIMESMHQSYGAVNYDNGVEFYMELDDGADV